MPVILVTQVHIIWISVLLISCAVVAHCAWSCNIFTIVSDIYPKNAVASMTGIAGFAAAIGGVLSAPFIGYLLDLTRSYVIVFVTVGCVYLSAWIVLKLMIPEIKPITIR